MKREILAIIPARAGSKGIPGKNLKPLRGMPLLAYSIAHALGTPSITRVVVSTDGLEIGAVAEHYGAEVIWRPDELSTDEASSESALLHVLDLLKGTENYEPELVVFLQATSPIRQPDDIQKAVEKLIREEADSLLSVVPAHPFLWQYDEQGRGVSLNYDYRERPRRQDRLPEYVENGSIYVFKPWVLRTLNNRLGGKIGLYEMGAWSAVDIDEPADLILCEHILASRQT